MRLVSGQVGHLLALYADRFDEGGHRQRQGCREARVRSNNGDEENRHCRD